MADVFFICVREDLAAAETLAEMFADAGYTVGGAPNDQKRAPEGAGIVLWSPASCWCSAFMGAAHRALQNGAAVIATLGETAPPPAFSEGAPVFDLSAWDGDAEDPVLNPLFFAVDHLAGKAREKAAEILLRDYGLGEGWTAPLPSGRAAASRTRLLPAYTVHA